jgi:hypothetical protein
MAAPSLVFVMSSFSGFCDEGDAGLTLNELKVFFWVCFCSISDRFGLIWVLQERAAMC